MAGTSIEWADKVWNPVVGCSRVSAGCDHCYAMGVAHRRMSPRHYGLTKLRPKGSSRPGVDWTGVVRFVPEALEVPLHWTKPRRIFVNSMSDLFHESLPFPLIDDVFEIMRTCEDHTFLVLTKRPQVMLRYFATRPEPLRNVHLGVSAEDQRTWDERVPLLAQCPAVLRWVSCEPLLGPIDIGPAHPDWLVVGGESGPGARRFNLAWAQRIVDRMRTLRLPVFVKQVGAKPYVCFGHDRPAAMGTGPSIDCGGGDFCPSFRLNDRKGGDPDEWPESLRVRQLPEVR